MYTQTHITSTFAYSTGCACYSVCMCVCMYVCTYIRVPVLTLLAVLVTQYECMYACTYVHI